MKRCLAPILVPGAAKRGQIIVPAIFVLPSLFLFVFLIYETAKLSREKIRHQFALDAAAFVEMTNYSDFLNRSAYVNGAFPQRIFAEAFMDAPSLERKNNSGSKNWYDLMWENGAFPGVERPDKDPRELLDPYPKWELLYSGPGADGKNTGNPPDFDTRCNYPDTSGYSNCLDLFTKRNAIDYWLAWDDAQDIYKLYFQVYSLLGSVEDAQYKVFCRLTGAAGCPGTASGLTHNFFRKSYHLNTGEPSADVNASQEGAAGFNRSFKPQAYCLENIMIAGNQPSNDPFEPYRIVQPSESGRLKPLPMLGARDTLENCGLFQVEYVPPQHIRDLRTPHRGETYPGYPITQSWQAPDNYFRVNFNNLMGDTGRPQVHATISLGKEGVRESMPSVWPNPTPKFQVELFP